MLMIPKRRNEFDLFEDMFKDPFFRGEIETKVMKTDIKELDTKFIIDIDLPGYEKEDIKIDITDGYLTVEASMNNTSEEKEEGKYVRRERYTGTCSRSFYVGEDIKHEDIKAKFKNGILKLEVPKKQPKEEIPETKYIKIDD